jgi:hypothetical protein
VPWQAVGPFAEGCETLPHVVGAGGSRVQMYPSSPERVALTSQLRRILAGDARQPWAEVQVSGGPLSPLGGPSTVCRAADPAHSRAGCRQSWAIPPPGRLCRAPGPVLRSAGCVACLGSDGLAAACLQQTPQPRNRSRRGARCEAAPSAEHQGNAAHVSISVTARLVIGRPERPNAPLVTSKKTTLSLRELLRCSPSACRAPPAAGTHPLTGVCKPGNKQDHSKGSRIDTSALLQDDG